MNLTGGMHSRLQMIRFGKFNESYKTKPATNIHLLFQETLGVSDAFTQNQDYNQQIFLDGKN